MLKLMKLELKKQRLGWYWKGALIAIFSVLMLMGILPSLDPELEDAFGSFEEVFAAMSTFVRVIFVIFAAVLIGKLIIQEYNNKTMSVMFTYPIPRKKLIMAKLLLIMGITFITILISNIVIFILFLVLNSFMHLIPGFPTKELLIHQGFDILIQGLSAVGISMVPLYFGMRKKSVSATIVSAIIIISLISSNNGGFSLSSFIVIPILVGVIGLLIAYLSFRNVEKVDVI